MKNYTNLKVNSLLAIQFVKQENKKSIWLFRCDCGKEKEIRADHVFGKHKPAKSCGCQGKDKDLVIASAKKLLFRDYRKSAIRRGYIFELLHEDVLNIVSKDCFYCGMSPNRKQYSLSKTHYFLCNGIDRMDNSIGYKLNNCVSCCTTCNMMKGVVDYNEFKEWINRLICFNTKNL